MEADLDRRGRIVPVRHGHAGLGVAHKGVDLVDEGGRPRGVGAGLRRSQGQDGALVLRQAEGVPAGNT